MAPKATETSDYRTFCVRFLNSGTNHIKLHHSNSGQFSPQFRLRSISRIFKEQRAFYFQILAKRGPNSRFVVKALIARSSPKPRWSRVINLMNWTTRVECWVINWVFSIKVEVLLESGNNSRISNIFWIARRGRVIPRSLHFNTWPIFYSNHHFFTPLSLSVKFKKNLKCFKPRD